MAKLRKQGHNVMPVAITGRTIATTFWGKAWCDNLESYRDYENRLPRGRTYVRNGSVVDLQIAPRDITAIVSGSELYKVKISIKSLPGTHWRSMCSDCASGIDSLIEVLQGRLSQGVMQRLCRQKDGLFPRPAEISFSCTCPDSASLCKHVAAALYGVGARLDSDPELLFRLREVAAKDLVANLTQALPVSRQGPGAAKVLDSDDIAGIFGLDMAAPAGGDEEPTLPVRKGTGPLHSPTPRKKAIAVATARSAVPSMPASGKAASDRSSKAAATKNVGHGEEATAAANSLATSRGPAPTSSKTRGALPIAGGPAVTVAPRGGRKRDLAPTPANPPLVPTSVSTTRIVAGGGKPGGTNTSPLALAKTDMPGTVRRSAAPIRQEIDRTQVARKKKGSK
jgi:uncharacterized Zn finger protein